MICCKNPVCKNNHCSLIYHWLVVEKTTMPSRLMSHCLHNGMPTQLRQSAWYRRPAAFMVALKATRFQSCTSQSADCRCSRSAACLHSATWWCSTVNSASILGCCAGLHTQSATWPVVGSVSCRSIHAVDVDCGSSCEWDENPLSCGEKLAADSTMLQDVFGLLPACKAGHVHECILPMLLRSRGAQACDACTAKPGQQWLSSLPLHMASCVLYACWITRAVQQDQKDSQGVPVESNKSCCSIKSQAHLVMKADITPNLC